MKTEKLENLISLDELVPMEASFHLSKLKKNIRLKTVSVRDEVWVKQKFGCQIQELVSSMKIAEICEVAYRIMHEEDKQHFAEQNVTFINEKGQKATEALGGVDLFMCLLTGINEQKEMIDAVMATVGFSQPVMKKIADKIAADKEGESEKKKAKPSTK